MIVSLGIEGSGVPFLLTQGRAQTEERVLLGQVALDTYRCWRKSLGTVLLTEPQSWDLHSPSPHLSVPGPPLLGFRALTHLGLTQRQGRENGFPASRPCLHQHPEIPVNAIHCSEGKVVTSRSVDAFQEAWCPREGLRKKQAWK